MTPPSPPLPSHDPPAPRYPRAPTHAAWLAMSEAERRAVVDALPGTMTDAELHPPEGDDHLDAKVEGRATLRGYFGRTGATVYVGSELTVYYPDEDRFAPDLFAVRDVPTHRRQKWVVDAEGRGLECVLEVLVTGDRRKDLLRNVSRYARLGILEYFVFDHSRRTLFGWRLPDKAIGLYREIPARTGWFYSEVLGMELTVQGDRLRFRRGNAELLTPAEEIERIEDLANDLAVLRAQAIESRDEALARAQEAEQQRDDEARRRADAEQQRDDEAQRRADAERQRDDEAQRRADAEQRLAALEAELTRLRGG